MMNIGTNIRTWRKKRAMTQNELSKKACISRSYLAGIETGAYNPSLHVLYSIAAALNVAVSVLVKNEIKEDD